MKTKYKLKKEAQEILDLGGFDNLEEGSELFEFSNELACSDGFGYGLFEGGYIRPEQIIEPSPELDELKKAIKLVAEYKELHETIAMEC